MVLFFRYLRDFLEEAIQICNQSEFTPRVFTNDFPKAFEIAEKLEVVLYTSITRPNVVRWDNFPFLASKDLGLEARICYSIEAMTREIHRV